MWLRSQRGTSSLALKADGNVALWGTFATVGVVPGQTNPPSPPPTNVVAIAGGREHYLALKADGTVAARGANRYGQASVPPGLSNVVAVAAGEYHRLALRANGAVVAWGAGGTNVVGFPPIRPGDLPAPNLGQSIVPADMTNVSAIAAGYYHS